jgi:hypothetical protein
MTYNLTNDLTLSDEHAASSNGIPVLLFNGRAFGSADHLPAPFGVAGYDADGNHTGNGGDKCSKAGKIVEAHVGSIPSNFPTQTYNWIKSFYTLSV